MQDIPTKLASDSPHLGAVLDLVQSSFAFMDGRIDPPSSMHRLTAAAIREQCETGEIWTLGMPPHACIFLKTHGDALYIGKLAVAAARRGEGCARDLVALAEKRAADLGLSALELETRVELVENHEAFSRLGFQKHGEGSHPGYDRPTFVIMRKRI